MKAKKDTKQLLFENMAKLNPTFKPKLNEDMGYSYEPPMLKSQPNDSYKKIMSDFPGHAKSANPIDSPQYKWYQRVSKFIQGNNNVNEKAELVKFFQNNFLGMDYDILQTPAETVSWWLSPEQQEFIKDEMNTPKDSNDDLNEDSEFQEKIKNGDVWLDYYAPSDSEEYTDGQFWYNRSGQAMRDPEEYNPHSDGYTPFGDESVVKESPMFGGEKVSQDQYDELQYDKANMEKAMGDAFKTPEGYQMKHPANPGETIQLKDGDNVLVKSIDQATGNINVRLFFNDKDAIKFSPKGYADVSWSPVQFDTIVG
jgi:hypothetical protein